MAEEQQRDVQDFQEGPASKAMVSLSQALLAPLDSIFKAQIHAARVKVHKYVEGFVEHYRPWFLIDQPISVEGHIAAPAAEGETGRAATIQIAVKVSRIKPSAGLDKLLTVLTETAKLEYNNQAQEGAPAAGSPRADT